MCKTLNTFKQKGYSNTTMPQKCAPKLCPKPLFFGIFSVAFYLILRKICIYAKKKRIFMNKNAFLVGRGGFEPPKSKTSDLQSDPFGRSGICPFYITFLVGAGDWTRTHNLLITNQLLCQLSYTGLWCFWLNFCTIFDYHTQHSTLCVLC